MSQPVSMSKQMLRTINGVMCITVINPLPVAYVGLNLPAGSILPGENGAKLPVNTAVALSIDPGGTIQGRELKAGWTPGAWEAVTQDGSICAIHPDPNIAYAFVVA